MHFPIRPSLLVKLLAGRKDQWVKAVDGVDLQIYPGETLGLVGESGCGKTSLGRVLARLYEPTAGEVTYASPEGGSREAGQKAMLLGEATPGAPAGRPQRAHRVSFYQTTQLIFQNPYSSLNPRKTVRQIVSVPLRNRGLRDPMALEAEVARLLRRVGIPERRMDAYPHQFSGGQRQRIGIARALAMQPRFIVCDEPVSALDVSIQAQVINLLAELQEEFRLTYLFIAHDLSVVRHISDRVAVMYLGRIVELAENAVLYGEPLHPYTQALLSAVPIPDPAAEELRRAVVLQGDVPSPADPPPGCHFHTRCPAMQEGLCDRDDPILREVRPGHFAACHLVTASDYPRIRAGENDVAEMAT